MRTGLIFAALAVALHPVYLVIYRLSIFAAVPRDDYAPFLLWLLGRGGALPDSPYCYRILSMAVTAPFFWLAPVIPLTNTPAELSADYLRATAALAMVSYLAWIATAMLAYATARRAQLSPSVSALAGVLAFAAMLYVQVTAVDPLAVAMIAAGVWLVGQPRAFAVLIAASILVNEKVALVLAVWLALRCALSRADRAALGGQALAALAGVAGYLAIVAVVHAPGNPYQREPGSYPQTLLENLAVYGTARGTMLNTLPILTLMAVALLGRPVGTLKRRDALVVPALAAVALILTHLLQAGRIVMHAAPLYAAPAAAALAAWSARAGGLTPACAASSVPAAAAPETVR